MKVLARSSNKPKSKTANYARWMGAFDWCRDYGGVEHRIREKYANEEDYIASLTQMKRANYLRTREIRLAKWKASRFYQRSLRMTDVILRKEEKKLEALKRKRFKAVRMNNIDIPADAMACVALAVTLGESNE